MLNWRPVREIEQRTRLIEQRTKLIENETEQLRKENARLKELNAKGRALLSCVDQLCFPPDSISTPAPPTADDGKPSSP
jgi:hypothetical protein